MIPKLSGPLVKDIRTGEGILEYALAALAVAAGATGELSVSKTGLYLTILAVSKSLRRGLLKVVALQKGAGIGAPILPAQIGTFVTGLAGDARAATNVLTEIAASQSQVEAAQAAPGAPADQISSGLAPTPPDPTPPAT